MSFLDPVIQQLQTTILPQALVYIIPASPILLAVTLGIIFWHVWVRYIRAKFILGLKYTVFEIKLPKDTFKSPLAMEVFLTSIHNTSDGNKFKQFWLGEFRPWYSLELVSVEGQIKFYMWTEDRRKVGLLAGLYSQFPGIEAHEAVDYTQTVNFDGTTMKAWGCEMKFNKPDYYPIKTYVDYNLQDDPKEEFKIDPMTPLLEWLGSVGPNSQVWIQVIINAHREKRSVGHLWKKEDHWKTGAMKEVNKILLRDAKTKVSGEENEETGLSKKPTISKGEQDVVEAIERSLTKPPFDVGIRAIYIAEKSVFSTTFGIGGIIGSFKQFHSEHLNGIKPNGDKWIAALDYPWQDYNDVRRTHRSKELIKAFRRRSYFYPPYEGKPLVLNTEELATIYHFPGSVAGTPTLERIPSKKAQAPSNLPI